MPKRFSHAYRIFLRGIAGSRTATATPTAFFDNRTASERFFRHRTLCPRLRNPLATGIEGIDLPCRSHLKDNPMKINMHQFNEHLEQLSNNDIVIRQKAASNLAKYSSAEWQGSPDAVFSAVSALAKASRF